MKNRFSIIIPAYNCEKTIVKCIESVLNQNYDLYEIVVVNDGSKDNTLEILKKEYSDNKKIKILNKSNSGVSDARNLGIKNSSFDWILFLDSDDWIEDNSLNYLNDLINEQRPDFIITQLIYNGNKDNNSKEFIIADKKNIIDNIICLEYSDKKFNSKYKNCRCIGGKLIKRSIVLDNGILFPSGIKKFEDGIFCLNAIEYSSRVLYSNYQFYNYYYDNPESRMNTFNKDDITESKKIFEIINDYLISNNIVTESINYLAFYMFILSLDNLMHQNYEKDIIKDEIKKLKFYYFPFFKNIEYKYLGFNKKIELFASRRKGIWLLYFLYVVKIKLLRK